MNICGNVLTYFCYCLLVLALGCGTAKKLPANNEELLLEIYTDASESIYPPGKTLDLRVYVSGKTEFDHYSPDDLNKLEPPAPQLKQTSINNEQLSAIQSVLDGLDSERPKSTYPPIIQRTIDSRIVITITYKSKEGMKSITINENDSYLHLDDKPSIYPRALIKLLRLNYQIGSVIRKASI